MRELARATRRAEPHPGDIPASGDGWSASAPPQPATAPAAPVTAQPRAPAADVSRIEEFLWQLGRPRTIVVGVLLILALGIGLVLSSGPRFIRQPRPINFEGDVRPLPVEANSPMSTVFAVLGTRTPETHPDAPVLARYSYGSDLVIDALNGRVYAVTFSLPNRSWKSLRIGVSRQNAEGAMALLATPEDRGIESAARPQRIAGYAVYPSLDSLPIHTLVAGVRPPNGCYDVRVELQPRSTGILVDGDARYAVIGPEGTQAVWVVTRIRIVSRAVRGPYVPDVAC